ncbi:Lrp/AsnC family transcriptional regulator [uncultured Lentibacter sp.]|uniref:Lrp/AsnC family transcriptional regulator n=1 Tax=uncultured Lentibacter sp. TaxID=1659309 RepID=UPI00260E739F|nr:Lrp/AsnC family transcriptional regulator [uncultured Lentibacter sp.]
MRDRIDSTLLAALQENAQVTAQELAERLGLSPSQAARRRLRLEASGVIRGYRAELDAEALGLGVQAFVQVQLRNHDSVQSKSFGKLIKAQPEIVSAWSMTGDADLLLRVYCQDLASLNHLIHAILLAHGSVSRVHSQIVMNQLKQDAALPA